MEEIVCLDSLNTACIGPVTTGEKGLNSDVEQQVTLLDYDP